LKQNWPELNLLTY